MKVDSDQVFCHGTADHKPDPKPFECNDNVLDSIGLKSGKGFVKENRNGVFCDLKCGEDGLRHGNKKDVGDAVPSIPSTQMGSFEKDSVFSMDRNVMERDLPELIVCYKENAYDVVKDICIDEGVPSQDKFLFNTTIDEKNICTLMPPEKDINGEMVQERVDDPYMHIPDVLKSLGEKEKGDLHKPNPELLKSSEELCSKNEFLPEFDFKDVLLTEEVKDEAPKNTAHDSSEEGFSLGHLLSMPELDAELSHRESSNNSVDEVEQQSSQKPRENAVLPMVCASRKSENGNDGTILPCPPLFSTAAKMDNGHEKAILGSSALDFVAEESDHGCDKSVASCPLISAAEESDNGIKEKKGASQALNLVPDGSTNKTGIEETGSIITFKCDSSTLTASGRGECPQSGEPEHVEKQNSYGPEDTTAEPLSSQVQYSHGESSFSAAGSVSGLITYSGPIAYSGSLSIRSDSSTTSTRSFAFPVLQSEWNSSPVRMAKADQRHFRKHKCWRQGLLCCRF